MSLSNSPMHVQSNTPLKAHNTFGIEATAAHFIALEDRHQLAALRDYLMLHGSSAPALVLGGGSNVLLTRDVPGLTVQVALKGIDVTVTPERILVRAAAGENWHAFVSGLIEQQIGGLENLSLIPGTVGAAPIQNIGAYGTEVGQHIAAVEVMDWRTGEITELSAAVCCFSYRDSIFKQQPGRWLILSVLFALPRAWQPALGYRELADELAQMAEQPLSPRLISDAVCAIRRRKLPDPAQIGNAGSFFKNPVVSATEYQALLGRFPGLVSYAQPNGSVKLAAGWLIDQCGWKGRSLGAAGVHDRQALVLVNRGGATGADIVRLAQAIQDDVMQRYGVVLEAEPVWI